MTTPDSTPIPPPAAAPSFFRSHGKKIALGLAGGVVACVILAWQVVPIFAKSIAEEQGSAALGRKVTIGKLEFKPWSMEVDAFDIAIAGAAAAGDKNPQLHIAHAYVNAEWESLLRMEPVLESVTVDTPYLRVAHLGKGAYDFDDILQTLEKAKDPNAPPDAAPMPFAIYNIRINNGAVDFSDHISNGANSANSVRQHQVRGLQLGVPFLSNIAAHRTVKVQPRLAFELNGSHFDTIADATPFATTQPTSAHFKIANWNLAPYAVYLPQNLPIKPQSAVLDADIQLRFEPPKTNQKIASLVLSGTLKASNLTLTDSANQPALAVDSIALDVTEARPLERFVKLQSLTIQAPALHASRSKEGKLNWDFATKTGAANADSTGDSAQKPWNIQLENFALNQGSVHWTDANPQAQLSVEQWELKAQSVSWPLTAASINVTGGLSIPSANNKPMQVSVKAQVSNRKASAQAVVRDANLALAAPYLTSLLEPTLYGIVDADLDAAWSGAGLPKLSISRASVRNFALKSPHIMSKDAKPSEIAAHDLPSWEVLDITNALLDFNLRSVAAQKIILRMPSVMVHRNAAKEWVALKWLKSASKLPVHQAPVPIADVPKPRAGGAEPAVVVPSSAPSAPSPVVPSANVAAAAWKFNLDELQVEKGNLRFDDRGTSSRGIRFELPEFNLKLNSLSLVGNKPMQIHLTSQIKSSHIADKMEAGTLAYKGTIQWEPVIAKGSIDIKALPLHVFAPYLANDLNFSTERADASYKGEIQLAMGGGDGMQLQTKGDAMVEDVHLQSSGIGVKGGGEELVRWKSLQLPGMNLRITPNEATQFQLAKAILSDFYARVIVDEKGRLNLQNLQKTPTEEAPAPAASNPLEIVLGPIQVTNGEIKFSDHYIQPNYSVNLTKLQGRISQFSSIPKDGGAVELADITISGRAENTALLEVTGKINPVAKPLVLNIRGRVEDLDLPPLTAYAEKYAGYNIERGKLNMDVRYEIKPNGILTASNQLLLKQLSFGEKIKDAPNSLPVKLAMTLLSDRNGMINLDLPITGSLNDPDFQIGAVLWKIFSNLITKALTAPFSLLAKAFGGDDGEMNDWGSIKFPLGSSALDNAAKQVLDKLILVLKERPDLDVGITGEAELQQETEGLRQEQFRALLLAEKNRRAINDDTEVETFTTWKPDEYPDLLRAVYRRADIPKPRNWLGMLKDIPQKDMEVALLANLVITEDSVRELALERSNVVKEYLLKRALNSERIFLQAPKTTHGIEEKWEPRVQLGVITH